jgi:hypothetical protein
VWKLAELSENCFTSSPTHPSLNDTFGSWEHIRPSVFPSTPLKAPTAVLSPRSPVVPRTAGKPCREAIVEKRPLVIALPDIPTAKMLRLQSTGTATSLTRQRLRAHFMALSPTHKPSDISPRASATPRSCRQNMSRLMRRKVEMSLSPTSLKHVVSLPAFLSDFKQEGVFKPAKLVQRLYS